jgi:hypothetical protein
VFIDNSGKIRHKTIRLKDVSESKIVESGIRHIEATKSNGTTLENRSKDFSLALILKDGNIIDLPIYSETQEGVTQRFKLMNVARNWKRKINSIVRPAALQLG